MAGLGAAFRSNLARAMQAHPDKQWVICQRAGYNPGYVRRVVIGAKPNPTLYFVECMAAALGVDPLELLKD
jgi:hypothetical protein